MLRDRSKLTMCLISSVVLFARSYSGPFDEGVDNPFDAKKQETPVVRVLEQPLEKPKIKFVQGDLEVTFGGKLRMEYDGYHNAIHLNDSMPDDYGFFMQTLDLNMYTAFCEKHFGHKAL